MDRAIVEAQLRQIVTAAEATKAAAEALLRELAVQEIDPGPVVVPEPTPPQIPEPTPPSDGEASAARLVAMKLALDGMSREEARRRLAVEYELTDLDSLLDDVYARARR